MEASRALCTAENTYLNIEAPKPDIQSNIYRGKCKKAAILLADGNTIAGTAAIIGVHRDTLQDWTKSPHFSSLIEAEKTRARNLLLNRIRKSGEKPHLWAANAWILERNKAFGDEFKLNQDKGHGSNVTVQIAISHPAATQVLVGTDVGNESADE